MAKNKIFFLLIIGLTIGLTSCGGWFGSSSDDPLLGDTTLSLAVQEWSKRIDKYPENVDYRYQRGMELVKSKRFKLALADLNTAIEMAPTNAKYIVSRG